MVLSFFAAVVVIEIISHNIPFRVAILVLVCFVFIVVVLVALISVLVLDVILVVVVVVVIVVFVSVVIQISIFSKFRESFPKTQRLVVFCKFQIIGVRQPCRNFGLSSVERQLSAR